MSAIEMRQVSEPYIRRRAVHHLEKGYVVILAAARAILTSPPTPRRLCAHAKSMLSA